MTRAMQVGEECDIDCGGGGDDGGGGGCGWFRWAATGEMFL